MALLFLSGDSVVVSVEVSGVVSCSSFIPSGAELSEYPAVNSKGTQP
ncbi:MAG: hypothetical protein K2K02_09335 [Ruminococcus sp.]|nr:hypothetical protein [Ruminococcus sp.]